MNPSLLFFAVDAANVVCALIFGGAVLAGLPRNGNAQLVALLTLAAVCHIVLGYYDYGFWVAPAYRIDVGAWEPVLNFLRNTSPGLFMILVFRLFTDRTQFPRWLLALFALQLFLEEPVRLLPLAAAHSWLATQVAPTALQTLFAGFALYWTIENWRVDLVEQRRRSRAVVLIVLGFDVIASSLLLRVVIPQNSLANYEMHLALSVANLALVLFLIVQLLKGNVAAYFATERPPAEPVRANGRAETNAALSRIKALMETERLYREPGLSLGQLADRAQLPEYRLRRLINEELGYRNFNAFLHDYRIKDACAQLADPEMRRIPILTIALSVGYQSVNTFNRGFREIMGTAPSSWRARNLSPETE